MVKEIRREKGFTVAELYKVLGNAIEKGMGDYKLKIDNMSTPDYYDVRYVQLLSDEKIVIVL